MKRNIIIRSIALVLTLVLMLPMMPVQVNAHQYIPIYWTEEIYTRDGISGYIYELENVQKNCYGFNLNYEIDRMTKGNLSGDFNFEVCVHDTSGNWFVAEMFWLNETGKTVDVNVCWQDARNIDKFTVIPRKKNLEWYQRVSISNPKTEPAWYPWGIEYTYSDEKFEKSGKWTYPIVLEETLYDCSGFTLSYEIDEILKGTLTPDTNYDVYARASGGKWKKIHSFSMYNDEAIVDISMYYEKDHMDIDEIAVLCTEKKEFSYAANIAISDAYYDYDMVSQDQASNDSYAPSGYLSGYWSDTQKRVSTCYAYPFILDTPLKKCKGFTVDFEVEVVSGKMKSDSKFAVYIYNGSSWEKVGTFTLDDYQATAKIKMNKAKKVYEVVAVCLNSGTFSYNNYLGIRDVVY